jgi:hypothetical protein
MRSAAQFRNPEDRELYLSGLRLAAGMTATRRLAAIVVADVRTSAFQPSTCEVG